MPHALWVPVLFLVFAACSWSGRLLDAHYADRAELFAVALVVVSLFGPLLLGAGSATLWGLPIWMPLGVAIAGGLLLGRRRREV
jgi:uncharacterized protein (TIGR03382 family)